MKHLLLMKAKQPLTARKINTLEKVVQFWKFTL